MDKGRFGVHGGQYIPETLMNAVRAIRGRRATVTSPGSGSAFVRNISAIAWRRGICASVPPSCNEN